MLPWLPLAVTLQIRQTPRRKTASISVKHNVVIVVAPDNLTRQEVLAVVQKKRRWIEEKLRFNTEVRKPLKPKEYVSGESFGYLGRNYRLKVLDGDAPRASLKGGRFLVEAPKRLSNHSRQKVVRRKLAEWYREHALSHLNEQVKRIAPRVGVIPKTVSVRDYQSRWGNCTGDGDVHFNWIIVTAPMHVVQYVVAHELCHLVHHNHSPAFWRLLDTVLPDWKARKDWLKVFGPELVV